MEKEITVEYEINDQLVSVKVFYKIEIIEDVQTISCSVNGDSYKIPSWLQLRRFELRSILEKGYYMPLFTDNENIKNINAVLFIDKAYSAIMSKEKLRVFQHPIL